MIETCAKGEEGKALLSDNIRLGASLGISGSPTWIINGRTKFHGVTAQDIQKNVCIRNPSFKGCEVKIESKEGEPLLTGSCDG